MTPEAQRIAIAEACGWQGPHHPENVAGMVGWLSQEHGIWWVTPEGIRVMIKIVPDYLNDTNAMHEAETFIRNTQDQMRYASETLIAMGFDDLIEASDLNVDYCWHAMGATASQRAEAFLRTLNLWTDEA